MLSLIIDQSSTCTGFAILDDGQLIEHGNLTSKHKTSTLRLEEFRRDLFAKVKEHVINEVLFEKIFSFGLKSQDAINALGAASHICKAVAELSCIPWYQVPPSEWKSCCGASGKGSAAQKASVKKIVCDFWHIQPWDIKSDDHSDALGIAAFWTVFAEDYRRGLKR